jgi:microcystin-dependent protein
MAEPFLSEIRMMSFGQAPKGWATCDGQVLPINQNQALFSVLGTVFGGNGTSTFALPDLRGQVPIHMGSGHSLGDKGGEQTHTLTFAEMPAHSHQANATPGSTGASDVPANNLLDNTAPNNFYGAVQNRIPMRENTITMAGGSAAHPNMQPFLVISFCIALQGIFPSAN